jgi:serine/threonine protein kinase
MITFVGASGRTWKFDTDSKLGAPGGVGEVFLGTDGKQSWAIKRIPLRFGNTRELRRRQREFDIASKLTQIRAPVQHILIPTDWGGLENDLYLVMPRAERSLSEAIAANDLDITQRYAAIKEVALGLRELASLGIIHRDLKPANVLRFQESWRLSDFGISRDIDVSTDTYTFAGVGTMPYMAPETWQLRPATPKTDLYALGVLAYETISGSRPFNGPNPNDYERQHLEQLPPPLAIKDGRMSRLVTRLLNKDPENRPQDAEAVVEIIESASRRLDSSREEVAESAAAMARVLSQREADSSWRARRADLGKQALSELGAFLEDFSEDMADAFAESGFSADDHYYKMHFDVADVLVSPIEDIELAPHDSAIAACSVQATLPGKLNDYEPAEFLAISSASGLDCFANLICDLINNRSQWSIATFSIADYPERGYHQSNVIGLRSEARARQGGFLTQCYERPLNVDTMMWLMRHVFESLPHGEDESTWLY